MQLDVTRKSKNIIVQVLLKLSTVMSLRFHTKVRDVLIMIDSR